MSETKATRAVKMLMVSKWGKVGRVIPSMHQATADILVRGKRAIYVDEVEPVQPEPVETPEPIAEPAAVKKKRKRRKKNVDDTNIGDGNSASDGTSDTFGGEAATGDAASE